MQITLRLEINRPNSIMCRDSRWAVHFLVTIEHYMNRAFWRMALCAASGEKRGKRTQFGPSNEANNRYQRSFA